MNTPTSYQLKINLAPLRVSDDHPGEDRILSRDGTGIAAVIHPAACTDLVNLYNNCASDMAMDDTLSNQGDDEYHDGGTMSFSVAVPELRRLPHDPEPYLIQNENGISLDADEVVGLLSARYDIRGELRTVFNALDCVTTDQAHARIKALQNMEYMRNAADAEVARLKVLLREMSIDRNNLHTKYTKQRARIKALNAKQTRNKGL